MYVPAFRKKSRFSQMSDCCQELRDAHAPNSRPCKVEVSCPFSRLCKYGLLDQTVSAAHTHTHTHSLSLTSVLWGVTHTYTMASLRPSQPASLAAIQLIPVATVSLQHAWSIKHMEGGGGLIFCYPKVWTSAHRVGEVVVVVVVEVEGGGCFHLTMPVCFSFYNLDKTNLCGTVGHDSVKSWG